MGSVGLVVKSEIMEGPKDCRRRPGGGMADKTVCSELIR